MQSHGIIMYQLSFKCIHVCRPSILRATRQFLQSLAAPQVSAPNTCTSNQN